MLERGRQEVDSGHLYLHNIVFSVYNLVGKIIHQETIIPQTGFNRITYTPSVDITQGIYLYKLNNGKQVITKRFIYSGN